MELEKALSQISEIHGHLARSEVYRGYRPLCLALSGLLALLAAGLQETLFVPGSPAAFVEYWAIVAAVCGALSASDMAYNYFFREDAFRRNKTRRVVEQFLPCLVGGAALTICLARGSSAYTALIPGLWAILFSMGIFSTRPYLPRAIGWVGLYYLVAGSVLLLLTVKDANLSPWGMGITFGAGQILAAGVLHCNVERTANTEQG